MKNLEGQTMRKSVQSLYYFTVIFSSLVGLWHFFVPRMFQWYDYIPTQYENLIVGIDYANYCFSLLLFGLSILLVILGKKALSLNLEVIIFYIFLTVVWFFRAMLSSVIEPWPLEPIAAAAIGQLLISDMQAILMVIMSVIFLRKIKKSQSKMK